MVCTFQIFPIKILGRSILQLCRDIKEYRFHHIVQNFSRVQATMLRKAKMLLVSRKRIFEQRDDLYNVITKELLIIIK